MGKDKGMIFLRKSNRVGSTNLIFGQWKLRTDEFVAKVAG
jgi:hypothetical protein